MNVEEIFGRIRKLKDSRDWTNEELSARSGIALGTLNKFLADGSKREPKLCYIMQIAEAFGITEEYLIFGTKRTPPAILKKYERLEPIDQAKAEAYVDGLLACYTSPVYRAAKSDRDVGDQIVNITEDELEALKRAPETDENL